MLPSFPPAILALADGTVFRGYAIGAAGHTIGEVVFNTAITGYQEILTDPSYARQIVTLTYPHIGNTGVNGEDVEATKVHAAGLIIKDLPILDSNFRANKTLSQYLKDEGVVAIAGIDTRRLTRILRDKGAQNGCILAGEEADEAKAIALAQSFPGWPAWTSRRSSRPRKSIRGRKRNGRSRKATANRRNRNSMWSRSTTASSAISCACLPNAAAR